MEKINNIIFEKVWQDEYLIEIKITAISKFSETYQLCYVNENELKQVTEKISLYMEDYTQDRYIEFGRKEGEYTPAFSMKLMSADKRGHLNIEVDIEIADIDDRSHRCNYFVESELGAIERFGQKLTDFYEAEVGTTISMFL